MRIALNTNNNYLAFNLQKILRSEAHFIVNYRSIAELVTGVNTLDYQVIILDEDSDLLKKLKICRNLRKFKGDATFILLATQANPDVKLDSYFVGIDYVFPKPLNIDVFLATIRTVSRRKGEEIPKIMRYNQTTIDLAQGMITDSTKVIKLSVIECLIIKIFARNTNKIISYTDLSAHIWPTEVGISKNILNVYLNKLRKKLKDFNLTDVIITVQGYGYKLKPYNLV